MGALSASMVANASLVHRKENNSMPMKMNVGLSRKIGEANYGSRGASINLELELDSGLATDSARLQERIRQLFGLVRKSLDEELRQL